MPEQPSSKKRHTTSHPSSGHSQRAALPALVSLMAVVDPESRMAKIGLRREEILTKLAEASEDHAAMVAGDEQRRTRSILAFARDAAARTERLSAAFAVLAGTLIGSAEELCVAREVLREADKVNTDAVCMKEITAALVCEAALFVASREVPK